MDKLGRVGPIEREPPLSIELGRPLRSTQNKMRWGDAGETKPQGKGKVEESIESGKGYHYISDSVAQEASANGGQMKSLCLFLEGLLIGNKYNKPCVSCEACVL